MTSKAISYQYVEKPVLAAAPAVGCTSYIRNTLEGLESERTFRELGSELPLIFFPFSWDGIK
jgi:hypothetical protein